MRTNIKNLSPLKRVKLVSTLTAVFMFIGLLMTFKVWTLQHNFPVIKVLKILPALGSQSTLIVFKLLLVSTFVSIFGITLKCI